MENKMINIPTSVVNDIKMTTQHYILTKTMMRFKIIKFRSKISFIALQKRMTLNELFFRTVLKSYL